MNDYGKMVVPFSLFILLLFCMWLFLVIYQSFFSKWNRFCRYVVVSKHDSFVLTTQVSDFKNQCDVVLNETAFETNKDIKPSTTFSFGWIGWSDSNQDMSNADVVAICVQSVLTIVVSVLINYLWNCEHCSCNTNVILIYNVVTNSTIILLCCCCCCPSHYVMFVKQVMFSLKFSEIIVNIYMVYFYENGEFGLNTIWMFVLLLQVTEMLIISFKSWFFAYNIVILACYLIYEYLDSKIIAAVSVCIIISLGVLSTIIMMVRAGKHNFVTDGYHHDDSSSFYRLIWVIVIIVLVLVTSKDIVSLIVISGNDCDLGLVDDLSVTYFLFIGSVAHIIVVTFSILFITNVTFLGCLCCDFYRSDFIRSIGKKVAARIVTVSVSCCCMNLFFFAWSIIGFLMHSEMKSGNGNNIQCKDVVLIWSTLTMVEQMLLPCILALWAVFHSAAR
eukprot:375769_1